jgi:hypothetical protein
MIIVERTEPKLVAARLIGSTWPLTTTMQEGNFPSLLHAAPARQNNELVAVAIALIQFSERITSNMSHAAIAPLMTSSNRNGPGREDTH